MLLAINYVVVGLDDAARAVVAEALRLDARFSLKIGVEGEFNLDNKHVAADLSKAGLG